MGCKAVEDGQESTNQVPWKLLKKVPQSKTQDRQTIIVRVQDNNSLWNRRGYLYWDNRLLFFSVKSKSTYVFTALTKVKLLYCYAGLSDLREVTDSHCFQKSIQSCSESCTSLLTQYTWSDSVCVLLFVQNDLTVLLLIHTTIHSYGESKQKAFHDSSQCSKFVVLAVVPRG